MLDLLIFILGLVVVPVLINRTTETHLHWLKPQHLRPIWTVVFAIFSLYLLQKPTAQEFVMSLHQRWHGWIGYAVFGVAGAVLLAGYWWLTGVMLKPPPKFDASNPEVAQKQATDEKPPTLLDLFRKDFPNVMKGSDSSDVDAYTIGTHDGVTIKVKRQIYEDYAAKTKFIGFYIGTPTPPAMDFSGRATIVACMELLNHNAVQDTFDHFMKSVAVMSGYGDEMTTSKDLTFSGRVLIYHEEFLPIENKADILRAYQA